MLRIMLLFSALAACTPSFQEAAMHSPKPLSGTTLETEPELRGGAASRAAVRGTGDPSRAAQGPIQQPVSAAGHPAPASPTGSSAGVEGRRTLSTAFVRIGPDGHLTVELRDGRVVVLRDVVMRPKDYCGVHVLGGARGSRYCGGYADVAAARPGGAPTFDPPASATADPVGPGRRSSGHR